MFPFNAWHVVHDPLFAVFAIAGVKLNCVAVCAFDSGPGANAFVYQ